MKTTYRLRGILAVLPTLATALGLLACTHAAPNAAPGGADLGVRYEQEASGLMVVTCGRSPEDPELSFSLHVQSEEKGGESYISHRSGWHHDMRKGGRYSCGHTTDSSSVGVDRLAETLPSWRGHQIVVKSSPDEVETTALDVVPVTIRAPQESQLSLRWNDRKEWPFVRACQAELLRRTAEAAACRDRRAFHGRLFGISRADDRVDLYRVNLLGEPPALEPVGKTGTPTLTVSQLSSKLTMDSQWSGVHGVDGSGGWTSLPARGRKHLVSIVATTFSAGICELTRDPEGTVRASSDCQTSSWLELVQTHDDVRASLELRALESSSTDLSDPQLLLRKQACRVEWLPYQEIEAPLVPNATGRRIRAKP